MNYMTTAEIREAYLSYFENKGCKRLPSSSLIPDDPSLLLTSAGMVQFKPYFLQQKHLEAPYIGTTTVQKCVRTNDIDIIGTDGRHLSFFEMLGNFSFGAYFKQEMCAWALDFSVRVLGLPFEKLYFTVYEQDDETIDIWKGLGVDPSHITKLGKEDNFWRAGPTGPCGPCSEIYYDQGESVGCGRPECAPGCECDRFLEYWNLVFTQYDAQKDGSLQPLPNKNIDTGMGLERIAAIMQGVQSNFDTDVLRGLISVAEQVTGKTYGTSKEDDAALRIMADHARSVTFMIADGILPGNVGREYVLRRLLRRAVMKGNLLGAEGMYLGRFVDRIIETMGQVYPEIIENCELIHRVVRSEEERFGATLRQGRAYLAEALEALSGKEVTDKELAGETAFTLHDTYGFPLEVTEEICAEAGISVNRAEFDACMEAQRGRARAATADTAEAAWSTYDGSMSALLEEVGATTFTGYDQNESTAKVVALISGGRRVQTIHAGEDGGIVLDKTPFYAEMGGQVGDTGTITTGQGAATVTDTKTPEKGLVMHNVQVQTGSISVGEEAKASIDILRRERIARNHSATHILHWALRKVLGDHVRQAGSFVAPDRLRFDFTHFEACTRDRLDRIEALANQKIMENLSVHTYETSLDEARAAGVTALFGEKYGEVVRVVDMEGFSRELCGGTHVHSTAEIGLVKITDEQSVGANLRRIEAITSFDALAFLNKVEAELRSAAGTLRVPLFDVSKRIAANLAETKELTAKIKRDEELTLQNSILKIAEAGLSQAAAGYSIYLLKVNDFDASALRNAWDVIRTHSKADCAVILADDNHGRPLLLAAGTDGAVAAGFHAGNIIRQIAPAIKGGGGGKPGMAQAGGKDVSGLDAALRQARDLLR